MVDARGGDLSIDPDVYPTLSKYAMPLPMPAGGIIGRENEVQEVLASLNRPRLSNILLLAPPGSGKALTLDTPIPTPTGWTTMGQIEVGDRVFGQDGELTRVTFLSQINPDPELYEVRFSDGSVVKACADHQWKVSSAQQRDRSATPDESVLTTRQMLEAGIRLERGTVANFAIRVPAPLELSERDLPIDPYALGVSLGEGEPKRIPPEFLRAGHTQRMALLRGLLVWNGRIDSGGAIELGFSSTDLTRDVGELIRTLGIRVTCDLDGYRVRFIADMPVSVAQGQVAGSSEQVGQEQRLLHIESVEPVPAEPARCIQVDNADHMYLAGEGFVPTHNTVLVQETMNRDRDRIYLEVDLARLQGGVQGHQMASELKTLFDEAEVFGRSESSELVLFIDEFHQIVQMDAAAVEALKPVLAASGARGLKIIGATTYEEWIEYIRPNKPLDERLQRVNLTPAGRMMTIEILRNFSREEGLTGPTGPSDALLGEIHDLTELHVPSSVQPRKSIGILDGMIGWHRQTGAPMDHRLLAKVMNQTTGVDIGFRIDGTAIQEELDKRVFAQKLATKTLADQMQLVVAGLHNASRPKGRFLLAGSTGVGKSNLSSNPVAVFHEDPGRPRWKTHGELEVGDKVFDRQGRPTEVLGVFPQGLRKIFRVRLCDGRALDVDAEHLWTVHTAGEGDTRDTVTLTTAQLIEQGVPQARGADDADRDPEFFLPMNGPARWPAQELDLDPHVLGRLLRGGRIPERYMTGSVDQRWALLCGLLGVDDRDRAVGDGHTLSYSTLSGELAQDVRTLLFSLGVTNTISVSHRDGPGGEPVEYHIHATTDVSRVGISSIEELPDPGQAVCILVDNDEHLYQAGEHFVVTHNTELTKQLVKLVFGDDPNKFIRFDMSEFARKESMDYFRSELTKKTVSAGQAVILLDEIEKADRAVLRLLLQVLDDGRLSDDNGRVVSFLDCYILMTTNAGSEVFETIGAYAADDEGSGAELEDFMKTIENAIKKKDFPPELLGRLDRIIPFQPLSDATKRKILQRGLDKLRSQVLVKHGVRLGIHERVLEYLAVDVGDDDVHGGGARESMRALEQRVAIEVARFINANPEAKTLLLSIEGKMRAEDPTLRNSRAWPKVEAAGR